MIGTRTKRDHCSIQSIQRPEPQKANTNERHGYLHISSCPETNFMLQVVNLKVENKILKSGICKTFHVLLHLEKKKSTSASRGKTSIDFPIQITALYCTLTNQITRYNSDLLSQPNTSLCISFWLKR